MKAVFQSLEALHYGCSVFSTLPHGPVEPTFIALQLSQNQDSWGDDSRISCTLGPLFAPCGVHADNILVRGLAKFVRLGRPLRFELALSNYPSRTHAELNIAAASVAFHTHVSVSLVSKVSRLSLPLSLPLLLPLQATLTPAPSGSGSVTVTVAIPKGTHRDAEVVVSGVTFAGQAVTGGQALPVLLRVVAGMQAPLRLEGAANVISSTPIITPDGTIYAPKIGSSDVLVFAGDGTPLPPLPLKTLGLSNSTRSAAFVEATGTLLLADINGDASKLVAVDAASRAVRWSAALGGSCWGIAVLSAQGVVVVSDLKDNQLHAHRLSDGTRIASVEAREPTYVAADPATSTMYVSTSVEMTAFRWDGAVLVAEGAVLVAEGFVEAAGATGNWRPLAVVPPATGQHTSYLVVGTKETPTLLVLTLPDRRLVHTHKLEGMRVVGLAADPSGTALAVCDGESKAIHVLPWPLPGMEF